MDTIGLFPLGIVLFPDATLPLHIFEQRYKELINAAVEKKLTFGINLVENSHLFEVGCTARVSDVLAKHEDGTIDIAVKGGKRFRLKTFREGEASYYKGDIEYFDDVPENIDILLLNECMEHYNSIVKVIFGEHEIIDDLAEVGSTQASFFFAQKSGLSLLQKQNLLEMTSENKRLLTLKQHMEDILPKVRQAEYIDMIIRNDGYFPPSASTDH